MSEESEKQPKKKTLLQKYEIPIEYLDFDFVKKCEDAKLLERIVTILRSGQEGFYPDLTKWAEERLRLFKPNSKLFRVENPLLKVSNLEEEKRSKITEEMKNFVQDMKKNNDGLKKHNKTSEKSLPPIRKSKNDTSTEAVNSNKTGHIKSLEYDKWDKYDADAEVLKIDLDEERQREIVNAKNRKNKKIIEVIEDKEVEALSEVEKEVLSVRYKEKGNDCFKSKDYEEAIQEYTQSIRILPSAAAFNNRSLMHLKLKNYQKALNDCNACLKMDPDNLKSLVRKGQALIGLEKPAEAADAFEDVLELDPDNCIAKQELLKLRSILPPRNAHRMKIEEIGEPILNPPTYKKKVATKSEKLELNETKLMPSIVQTIVPEPKTPFDELGKKTESSRERLIMPGEQKPAKSKKILIEEIN